MQKVLDSVLVGADGLLIPPLLVFLRSLLCNSNSFLQKKANYIFILCNLVPILHIKKEAGINDDSQRLQLTDNYSIEHLQLKPFI